MNLQSIFLISAISLHFLLGFIQIYSFPTSKYFQKVYLAQYFESSAALEVVQLLLTNYGAYHFLVALMALLGQFIESYHLTQGILLIFLTNSFSILWNHQNTFHFIVSFLQFFTALFALLLPSNLADHKEETIEFPILIILLPAGLHILFFLMESLFFSKSKLVQKIFLGKFTQSTEAVELAIKYFFDQGLYNLKLAILTLYGLLVVKSPSVVIATLMIYFLAGLVLYSSSPRLWKGFIIQSLPALYGLYLLSDQTEAIYYDLLRSIYSEDDDHDH
jgi:uncharacterized membrane protein